MSTDAYSEWDAAYVLGSLSPVERREFERHMATCDSCASAVAELAALPGLLAKVSAEEASELPRPMTELPIPVTLLPRLIRSVERRRWRVRGYVAGALVAVAAAAAAAVLAIPLVFPTNVPVASPTTTEAVLTQVIPNPLSASIRMTAEGWGTRIEMNCSYAASGSPAPPNYVPGTSIGYAMYVTDVAGHSIEVATWTAKPGTTAEPSGTTSLALDEISSVDIRSVNGVILLRSEL